jgi:hypothetical protein
MKSSISRLKTWWPFQAIAILFGPSYEPTAEESERYWDAKVNSEDGLDVCVLYRPDDQWWWQQLDELRAQAAERKRLDKRLNCICIFWAAATAAVICFAVMVTSMYAN